MVRRSTPMKTLYERRYPHKVDVPVGPLGLGNRLTVMERWLTHHVAPDQCAQHGYMDRRVGESPRDWARFYFDDEAVARRFQQAFAADRAVSRPDRRGRE